MVREEFIEKLLEDGDYHCTCFINPPCNFCTDTVEELYVEYKITEITDTLEDIASVPNENNAMMMSASTYVEDIEFLIEQLNR